MSETSHPPSDEDLSAAIDGEADDDTLARIEASAEARARRDELATVARTLQDAHPPALDGDEVDRMIAAALDQPVAPRAVPRSQGGPAPWLVAAAIVALMGIGLTLVFTGRDTGGTDQASTAETIDTVGDEAQADSQAGALASPEASEAPADADAEITGATPHAGGSDLQDLGSFASGDELRTALAEAFPAPAVAFDGQENTRAQIATDDEVARCANQLQITLSLDAPPLRQAVATVDGEITLVYEFATTSSDAGQPTTLVAAVGVDACQPIVLFER